MEIKRRISNFKDCQNHFEFPFNYHSKIYLRMRVWIWNFLLQEEINRNYMELMDLTITQMLGLKGKIFSLNTVTNEN